MMAGDLEYIKQAIREAEMLSKRCGGSFEGWLWYILQPPAFMVNDKEIIIEYPNLDYTVITRYIIDKKTHEVKEEIEEVEE